MLLQGLILMAVGVGTVVGFLGLLVMILTLSSKIIPRFNHILPDEQPKAKAQKAQKSDASPDAEIAIAIAAAMLRQREQA
jgi:sodium pump decarboxylase gamma subunit